MLHALQARLVEGMPFFYNSLCPTDKRFGISISFTMLHALQARLVEGMPFFYNSLCPTDKRFGISISFAMLHALRTKDLESAYHLQCFIRYAESFATETTELAPEAQSQLFAVGDQEL
jgi:hypothetical protein